MEDIISWGGWSHVGGFIRLVPGLVLFPLTLVLSWKKFGNKALVTYGLSHDRYSAARLSDITITNCKDKPLVVHAVYIVVSRHILVPLKEFSPPMVVKGLESVSIECDPVSSYQVGDDPFEFDFFEKGEIYITTTNGKFKCELNKRPSVYSIAREEEYVLASAIVRKFGGYVYDDRVVYGLQFSYGGKECTAFVDQGGLIGLEWPFRVNGLRPENMKDADSVTKAVLDLYGSVIAGSLRVVVLNPLEAVTS